MHPSPPPTRHVAVTEFPGSRSAWFRQILEGIEQYVATTGGWEVRLVSADERRPELLADWPVHGAILFANAVERLDQWRSLDVPLINVASRHREPAIPTVAADNAAIGRLAAEHLAERGFRLFAFVGLEEHEASALRGEAFLEAVQGIGRAEVLWVPRRLDSGTIRAAQQLDAMLDRFVQPLTTPVGIFGWNDAYATRLVQSCRRLGVAVPERAAVIGCDDDEVWCGLCTPSLTSVQPPSRQIGFEAAKLLDHMIGGGVPNQQPVFLPPIGVHRRSSTETVAVDDPVLVRALEFIRTHATRRARVSDVMEHVGLSRRSLERRFRAGLGRTPLEEIHRAQMERATELLRRTDASLESIAHDSGYRDANHLIRALTRELQMSPSQYRQQYRIT